MHRLLCWPRRKDRSSISYNASGPLSRLSIEQNLPQDKVSNSVLQNSNSEDLWSKAYIEIRNSDNALVDRFEKILSSENPGDTGVAPSEEQLSRIIETKLTLMEQNKWVVNVAGKSVEVRKQVERIVKVVRIAKDSLSVVANIEPVHLGVPVAALCLLTPVSPRSVICCGL